MPDATTTAQTQSVPLSSGAEALLTWAGATDRGRKREVNQDAILMACPLFVVADGMGGHIGGEIASANTISRLSDVAESGEITPESIEGALSAAVHDIADHPETTDDGTGTTVTGIYLDPAEPESWVVLNIGDSRVYLQRDEALIQITTDHSLVQELVQAGRLSPEEAESHPYGNVITRAVGPSESVVPDYVRVEVVDGDRFVICSDGLTKELTDYGILHFLRENPNPADAVDAMLEAALENGGRDNISIVVVDVAVTEASSDDAEDEADEGAAEDDEAA
ncbi:PP2C family protein-serine/threonine phosphatase [Microbacterium sediminis]|uniref:Protein phosphatase n=1 Tax=Microbacterium sediminis TaxID=904291 RepID=A0A1B9NCI6_9MICO|nr:protein phosphatase 2C domain-containing protein [Microbacterium sediminis]OCG74310.1 protein phosphatase [Microbacterium sediminis]QBR73674.1 serine/threonine-protein phosphatase [Microbacterium sediminis]